MRRHTISLLLVLVLSFVAFAQKADPVDQNLRRDVAYLSGELLEGRRTGETGATVAAGYVANVFAQSKLKPGVAGVDAAGKQTRGFMQKFPYTSGVEIAADGNSFSVGGAAVKARPFLFSPNASADGARLVFAGYGIEAPEANYNDFNKLDVAGKVLLILDGAPDGDNPRSPFARFSLHAKAKLAKDKGAIALVVVSREDNLDNDRNANQRYDQSTGETAVPVFVVARAAASEILGGPNALKAIEQMTAARRDAGRVTFSFDPPLPAVSFKLNLVKKVAEAYNVVGVIEGSDPVLKNEYVVIGAHYDHLGRGGQGSLAVNSTEVHHGADDNASGTAAMMELARQFVKDKKNKRTLIFIAFSGEEEGLLGSKFYVNNPLFPLDKTVAMLNMDMVGRLNEGKLTVGGIGTAGEWKSLVEQKNAAASPLFNLQLSEDGFGPSDHSSFYSKQVPVLFFFTGTHNDYHKPSDTAEKINYDGLRKLVGYVGEIARAVDANPARPTYKVAQSSGQGDGRRGFAVTIGVVPGYGDSSDGMLLDGVRDGSPAALAGLKAGDKIVSFAGKEIRNVQDYTIVLGELKPDVEYDIVVMRAGQKVNLKVKPAARK